MSFTTEMDKRNTSRGKAQLAKIASDDDNDDDDSIELICVKNSAGNVIDQGQHSTSNSNANRRKYPIMHSHPQERAVHHVNRKKNTRDQIIRQPPLMIILCGIPGSGKSYFAQSLVSAQPNKFVRVCQDILKTRKKCESKCRQVLINGSIPIIDRCNFDNEQRTYFTDIAMEFDHCVIDCIFFDYNEHYCVRRCEERTYHETLHDSKTIRQVVARMSNLMHIPRMGETSKYRNFFTVRSFHQANSIMSNYTK